MKERETFLLLVECRQDLSEREARVGLELVKDGLGRWKSCARFLGPYLLQCVLQRLWDGGEL